MNLKLLLIALIIIVTFTSIAETFFAGFFSGLRVASYILIRLGLLALLMLIIIILWISARRGPAKFS